MDLHSTRATKVDPEKCKEIDEFITEPLLDPLLRTNVDDTTQNLSNIRAKNEGMGLPHLRTAAKIQHETSKIATEHLIKTIVRREELSSVSTTGQGPKLEKIIIFVQKNQQN